MSDLAKYTYSNIQNASALSAGRPIMSIVLNPVLVSSTISPGCTSLKYRAPIDKKPQDSEDITQPSGSSPAEIRRI